MRGGGGAGLAAARVGGAGHRPRDRANLDVVGEDWEGLVLQDTPIRGVAVATSSGTASKIDSQPTSPGQYNHKHSMVYKQFLSTKRINVRNHKNIFF